MKKNLRNTYLVLVTVIGLSSLMLYSTYAMFTASVDVGDFVNLTASSLPTDTSVVEYERLTLTAGETKTIDLNITNSTSNSLYYGVWYEMIEPTTINDSITIAKLDTSVGETIGEIATSTSVVVTLILKNETEDSITLNIGVGYSETSSLNLPTDRNIITEEFSLYPILDTSGANFPDLVEGLIPIIYNGTNWVVANTTTEDTTISYKLGDVNNDSKVDASDVNKLYRTISGDLSDFDSYTLHAGDVDGDGNLTTTDYELLYNYVLQSISTFPVGSPLQEGSYTTDVYKWYDYTNKQWANAVLVSDTNRESYLNVSVGTTVSESDILAYYVWIPRYKYKVLNINKEIGVDSYDAQTIGIDIVFESGKATTGTVSCNYDFTITDGSLSEICTGSNGDYYTHPAFTFGNTELRGIWVGKFEISSDTPDVEYGGGNTTSLSARIKPNVVSWKMNTVTNYSYIIQNMVKNSNEYGIDNNTTDSHMMKNIEWGSAAYLTHSKYGRCTNNVCTEVSLNDSEITGGGDYVQNVLQSTTGNIYGIYDMSGGALEYVMGNVSANSGIYNYNHSSGGSNFSYSNETEKYIDTYAYGLTDADQNAYSRGRLGDSTGEIIESEYEGWYSDFGYMPIADSAWFARGCEQNCSTSGGIFSFYGIGGAGSYDSASRMILTSLQ